MQINSKVAYSVQFLKSIGESHGEMAQARGVIKEIKKIGESLELATISWNCNDMPNKVNVKNLAIVGPNTKFCNC